MYSWVMKYSPPDDAEVEHRDDVRVDQARLQAGLVDELRDGVLVARQLGTQALEHERAA